MFPHPQPKKFLEHLPLIALVVVTSVALLGVYYLWAHPANELTPVIVNSISVTNPYYYLNGQLPDLDNCPGGPNAKPCYDEFGIQISCYNPNQNDEDFDRIGDICDPEFTNPSAPPVCTDADGDGYASEGGGCGEIDCNDDSASGANIHPNQPEICEDGIDQDCLGGDLTCPLVCTDADGDGYGVGAGCTGPDCDDRPAGADSVPGNADDGSNRHPGASEPCGGSVDLNCDGALPGACSIPCVDVDGDHYSGDPNPAQRVNCSGGTSQDCNDNNTNVSPGKTEICPDLGNLDENCSGFANCADFGCNSQLGPGGARCCWASPAPGHLDPSQCIAASGEICTALPAGGAACDIPAEILCQDTLDNDNDGPRDCADTDCAGQAGPGGVTCCQGDPDCSGLGAGYRCVSNACTFFSECNDGSDNDGDGLSDFPFDRGCTDVVDNDEDNCGNNDCEATESTTSCPQDCPLVVSGCTSYTLADTWTNMGISNIQLDAAGNIYTVNTGQPWISKYSPQGSLLASWGTTGGFPWQFRLAGFIGVDPNNGRVYVSDGVANGILVFAPKVGSNCPPGQTDLGFGVPYCFVAKWGPYDDPRGIDVDASGKVYVAMVAPELAVFKFDPNGNLITKWGSSGSGAGQFEDLQDVAVDSQGNVYTVELYDTNRVQKFSPRVGGVCPSGSSEVGTSGYCYVRQWGGFTRSASIAVDAVNGVYVSEQWDTHRWQKFDSNGTLITEYVDAGGYLGGIAADPSSNIVYVVNSSTKELKKFICSLSSYCGDGSIDRPNGSGVNEQCEFDPAGSTTLAGETTSDWGAVSYSAFQQSDGCVVCGASGGAQACQVTSYRNCANLADRDQSVPPTPFAWVVNTDASSGSAYVQTITQMAVLANVPKPGGGFYSIGDIVNEYQICKGGGPDPYYFHDYKTKGNCPGQIIRNATDLAVNLDLERNEVWVTYDYLAGTANDFSGVAFISDTLKKYCPANLPLLFPHSVAVDRAGDAWVAAWNTVNLRTVLRRYPRSTIANCAYQEFTLSNQGLSSFPGTLNVTPNGDLWLLGMQSAWPQYPLTYIANPGGGPNMFVSPPLLLAVGSPQDILVETDSSVLVATYQQLQKYRYDSGTKTIVADSGYNLTSATIDQAAVTFWPHPATGNLNTLWIADNNGHNLTQLNGLDRSSGAVSQGVKIEFTSNTKDVSASSDGRIWSTNDGSGSLLRCDPLAADRFSACDAPYYTEHGHGSWFLVRSNDFLGLKRSITLGANTLFYPGLDQGPLTAFDIPSGDPAYAGWNHRWGKVMYTIGGSGSVQVYLCFSDDFNDTNDVNCSGGTGWVLATNYNAALNDPQYQKKYLRIKAVKDLLATISDLEIGCTDALGAGVCPAP